MIKYVSTMTVPIHQADNTQTEEEFATIHVIFNDEVIAAPRAHVSELPEGLEPGDELRLVKV
jgi:hypothetical protein